MENLLTSIEIRAQEVQKLARFRSVNIPQIRDKITQILSFIGTNHIFDEYTKHDISHINAMFDLADKLIPEQTKKHMTSTEWLMLSLAIYFHDMGMVVTKNEYKEREKSDFPTYKVKVMNGDYGPDFAAKVRIMSEPEHFLYQEFVREHHAERVCDWIQGNKNIKWGEADVIYNEIQDIFRNLDDLFRRDLGTVCLSHHKNDLNDTEKYKLAVRYDNSQDSKVNLQYISIILRTADLLHITMDRTPTIAFRLISPNDPKSLVEWQKQMAVRSVETTSRKTCRENPNDEIVMDTIAVSAYFSDMNEAEAFFGLTAYLKYAREQINSDSKIVAESEKTINGENYHFPWKYIDEKDIEAKGFEKRQFQFSLDQEAILHLLVGHTLYNDSSVVLRELTQNCLDAISYQRFLEAKSGSIFTDGLITIDWNSDKRVLTFTDNGTGMTMFDIENYLLRVGASKYRDEEFMKQNKDFYAISRFGIGILTCFMIADDIDITTSTTESEEAICLSIRNVLGKYLVKYVQKSSLDSPINKHGTQIQLYIHEDVDMMQIEQNIRKWIVYPEAKVELIIDKTDPLKIGYSSPKQALERYYSNRSSEYKIEETTKNGVTLAYATRYNRYYDDYQIAVLGNRGNSSALEGCPIGTCIKGVLVDSNSPGYNEIYLVACCNVGGNSDAQTNVARSALESNSGKKRLLQNIYELYAEHVSNQFDRKYQCFGSYNRAASESYYLINPLIGDDYYDARGEEMIADKDLLYDALNRLSLIILEHEGSQKAVSPASVMKIPSITIIDNRALRAAEYLLGEANTQISFIQLLKFLDIRFFHSIPQVEYLMCSYNNAYSLHVNSLKGKEVSQIIVDRTQHSSIVRLETEDKRWRHLKSEETNSRLIEVSDLYLPMREVEIIGLQNEIGVKTVLGLFLVPNTRFCKYIVEVINKFDLSLKEDRYLCSVAIGIILGVLENANDFNDINIKREKVDSIYRGVVESANRMNSASMLSVEDRIDKTQFLMLVRETDCEVFDPSRWDERNLTY